MIGALKFKLDNVTLPCPFQGRFVICRLTLAMFNPHTKFEVSTITCYEDMKGNGNEEIVVLWGHSRSSEMSPFNTAHTTS